MVQLYVLFEHACGYSLFKVKEFEEVGIFVPQVEASTCDSSKFKQYVKLVAYNPFTSASVALENINAVCEGSMTKELEAFLDTNLPESCKEGTSTLGVSDHKLGVAIADALGVSVTHVGAVPEITRGIRYHLSHLIQKLTDVFVKQSELGLGHSFSRGKVKFNVNRVDNMIIQSIAQVDQMDKNVNLFSMRIREWYSYHFPELAKVVTDNHKYALCAALIGDRSTLTKDKFDELDEITMDSTVTQGIYDAARMSMGMDIEALDLENIQRFSKIVANQAKYKGRLADYLKSKMESVAPNVSAVIGDVVGARLISHAGSLTNLAKQPASTVQILGAEKALFRALKTRSKTPKYGLIYHSSFIGRAGMKNKGRISRFLANKCSIASRIDCFSENLNSVFGEKLREQVEERLSFYETGVVPRTNQQMMTEAMQDYKMAVTTSSSKKRKHKEIEEVTDLNGDADVEPKRKKKKKKKSKGGEELSQSLPIAEESIIEMESETPKKKNKHADNATIEESNETIESMSTPVTDVSEKKKKKKKHVENGDFEKSAIAEIDTSIVTDGSIKKKKKKKKHVE